MAGYFLLGTLAAFGGLSALWAMFGWLLPGGRGCAVVICGPAQRENLAVFRWLRSLGLLNCPVLVVSEEESPGPEDVEYCTGEQLLPRLKEERNRYYGTGTGTAAGHGRRGGISEL